MPRPIEQLLKQHQLNPNEWISVQEAARRLGLTNVQMERILACGPLYSKKIGSRRIVFTASVARLLEQQQQKKSASAKGSADYPISDAERQTSHIQSILDSASPQRLNTPTPEHPYLYTSTPPNLYTSTPPNLDTSTPRHSQPALQIERRIWRDPGRADYWIPSDRAAGILNISTTMVCRLASWGKLEREWADWKTNQSVDPAKFSGRRRAMFSLREVEARAARQEEKRAGLTYGAKDPERPLRPPSRRSVNDLPPGGLFSITEAAAILGIHRTGIGQMVRRGRLYAWQAQSGKRGSKMYVSAAQIRRIASDPGRQKRRQSQADCRKPGYKKKQRPVTAFQEQYRLWETTGNALKKRHRGFYTTPQAAQALGVSTNTIHTMRANGRLKGYRSPSGGDNRRIFNRRRWWFYKIEDVHALLNSSDYQRKRKAYWKARLPWAYGEEANAEPPDENEWYPHQIDHSPSAAEKMKMEMEGW